jgi:plastocyanin
MTARRTAAALAATGALVAGLVGATPIAAHTGGNPTITFRFPSYTPATVRVLPNAGQTVTWTPDAGTDFDHHPLVFDGHPEIAAPQVGTTPFPYTFTDPGRYPFHCALHGDSAGMRGAVLVTVNDPPVASFSAPLSADQGAAVSFDATSSIDPNGQALTYAWDFDGDRTFEETSTSPTVLHVFPTAGTVTVGLRVTDANTDAVGPESSLAFQTITIVPPATGPGPRGGGTRPTDVPPLVKVAQPRRQALRTLLRRGLAVRASTSKAGLASATLRRGRVIVGRGTAGFVAAGTRTLKVRLTAAGRRTLRRARPAALRLTVVLTDAAGNDSRATVAVPLRR